MILHYKTLLIIEALELPFSLSTYSIHVSFLDDLEEDEATYQLQSPKHHQAANSKNLAKDKRRRPLFSLGLSLEFLTQTTSQNNKRYKVDTSSACECWKSNSAAKIDRLALLDAPLV